jgi:cyclase
VRLAIPPNLLRKQITCLCILCASGWCFSAVQAKDNAELSKLAENVYAQVVSPDSDAVANAGVVILDHSVLVVDTHFTPEAGQNLLAAIRSLTTKPVRFVVNTHAHADHTHGNQVFADAQLIGSSAARRDVLQKDLPSLNRTLAVAQSQLEKLRSDMSKEKDSALAQRLREQIRSRESYLQTMSRLKIIAPFITLEDSLTIQDGKQDVRVLFLGKGHTDGDVVVFLPASKIAFVGDLFFNEAIPNVQDASILEWMKTLESVLKLEADKFVPGHGAVGDKKDVQKFLAYFKDLQAWVKEAVDRGDSMEEATQNIELPPKYLSYRFQNFFPANVQKMYAELKALQEPAPLPAKPPVRQ